MTTSGPSSTQTSYAMCECSRPLSCASPSPVYFGATAFRVPLKARLDVHPVALHPFSLLVRVAVG